jgi:transcription-repair coupling factor (superfamily II helicase)
MPISMKNLDLVPALVQALGKTSKGPVEVVGPWGSGKTLLAVQAARALEAPLLIITAGRSEAEAVFDDLTTFAGEDRAALFPAWEVLPSDIMNPADDIIAERMNTMKRLAAALERGTPMCVVMPVRSLLQRVPDPKRLTGDTLTLRVGEEFPIDTMLEKLIRMGYTRDVMVENRGEVSVRGGIVDVFPISSELPYRVEYFGDEIESIRRFEPETQRSVEQVEEIQILPRSEKLMLNDLAKDNALSEITKYFPANTVAVLDEPLAVKEEAESVLTQVGGSTFYLTWDDAQKKLARFHLLSTAQVAHTKAEGAKRILAPMHSITGFAGKTQDFWEQLKRWDLDGYRVHLVCVNSGERRRLHELLEEQGYRVGQDKFELHVDLGRLRAGFASPQDKVAVLSEREMFGRHYVRRTRRRFEAGATITQFSDLKAGDYIVHAVHGIGRYLGLRRFEGKAGDFMTMQYASGDTLFLPVTRIDEVQKYVAGDGAVPKVDKLGGATWAKAKAKVKKAVKDMTEELVKLYAARESEEGHAFQKDTPWQRVRGRLRV